MISKEEEILKFVSDKFIELGQKCEGGFIIVDVCANCGGTSYKAVNHDSCYNNQCECGYLSGFIGRNHAN